MAAVKEEVKLTSEDMKIPASIEKRGHWNKQLESTFSLIGYTVSLGNFWRFPYLCMRNGGGAFLIPYVTCLILMGLPLYFLELCIGQFSGFSPITVWRKLCPLLRGMGWSMLIISTICTIYYITIMAWILYYFVSSFAKELPWSTCTNHWNTVNCTTLRYSSDNNLTSIIGDDLATTVAADDSFLSGVNQTTIQADANATSMVHTPYISSAEEFWRLKVLDISEGIENMGGLKWDLALCLLVNWIIVYLCVLKGVKTSGKVVYFTVTLPYVLLTVLLVRGATLPGSLTGIRYYIVPDWSRLADYQVWTDASLQVFYSLGPSWGGLITMASYNKFHNNCFSDALVATLTCGMSSFYCGFAIFTIVGYMAHAAGIGVQDVVNQGPGLVFIVYPEALAKLPLSQFWAACFFVMLICLAIDGEFGMLETVISGITDEFPQLSGKRRIPTGIAVAFVMFLLGLPFVTKGGIYLFQIVDWYSAAFSCMVVGFLELFIMSYIYGIGNTYRDIRLMLDRLNVSWVVCWCGVTQVSLLGLLVLSAVKMVPPTYGPYTYPAWAIGIGWILAMSSIVPIPALALYELVRAKGTLYQRFVSLLRPSEDWGPQADDLRAAYRQGRELHLSSWRQRMHIGATSSSCLGARKNGRLPERELTDDDPEKKGAFYGTTIQDPTETARLNGDEQYPNRETV